MKSMEPLVALFFTDRSIAAAQVITLTVLLLVFMAIVLTVGVKLWGKASQPGSHANDTQDAPADSVPRIDHDVPPIFLSHSDQQKPFVEKLFDALQSVNHTAFFDKHMLPTTSSFPPHINRAACGCKLGVVVLSDDFLNSKSRMLELEMLVMKRGRNPSVLPLFYKLSTKDMKSPKNLSKWQQAWMRKAPKHANLWKQVVESLDSFSGVEFIPGTSEAAYIKAVVRTICNLLPGPILYDLSYVKGQRRLAEVVASQFNEMVARHRDTVCIVGLHGVGGFGKTTMCKIMGNFYYSSYLGKSCHIEFPSDGDDKKIVQECKKALKTLANLSDEHLLNRADDFDQVIQLMRANLSRYDVFLAIDNVWESSREKAARILEVGFSAESKILLTSRSEQVLKDLPSCHRNTHVGPLPSPDHEEAFQIFQETFSHGDLNSLVDKNQLDTVLKRCLFSGSYHPLALKALSQYVNRACKLDGSQRLPLILKEISTRYLRSVEDLIILNYVNLPEYKKYMFLDIAAVVVKASYNSLYDESTYAMARRWLSSLYKEYSESITITNLIYELASDGLIQLEEDGRSRRMIRVHDLYSDLARRQAASSSRFFTHGSTRSVEEIEWEGLERVVISGPDHGECFVEKLQQQECGKLQVLVGASIKFQRGIDMNLMPSLCVLKFERGTLRSIKNWSAATGLVIVHLYDLECAPPLEPVPSIPCLEELIIKNVKTVQGPPNLNGCQRLKKLVLAEASIFMKEGQQASYFNSLTNLERLQIQHFNSSAGVLTLHALVNLQWLHVEKSPSLRKLDGLSPALKEVRIQECEAVKKLPDLSGLTCLERLDLRGNASMEEVGGGGVSPALKEVCIWECGALKKVPNLSGLTCLERLELLHNASMEEVGGLSPALKAVRIQECGALKKVPDLSGLTCLERLELQGNASMEEVGGLSPALKEVRIGECGAVKKVPDLSGLTCLERLELLYNASMEEVGGLSPALKEVCIEECGAVKKVPDLSGLTCLERLELRGINASMEEMGGLSPALKEVCIGGCGAVKKVPDLSGLTCLERLELQGNASMEEVGGGGLSPALKEVYIGECGAVKKVPDLSGLTCLQRLELLFNASMEEVGGLSPALKELCIVECGALKRLPDLSGLTCLERLKLRGINAAVEEMGGLSQQTLKEVRIGGCAAVKKVPDLSGLTCLERLELRGNASMEEVGGLSPALKEICIGRCGALKRVPDLSGLTCLERLELCGNASMEELVGGLSPALKAVCIEECGALKRVPDLSGLTCLVSLELRNCGSLEQSPLPELNLIPHVSIERSGKLKDFQKKDI